MGIGNMNPFQLRYERCKPFHTSQGVSLWYSWYSFLEWGQQEEDKGLDTSGLESDTKTLS